MLGNISMTCWRGLYCAGQGASWISKPQREQGVSRAAQRWYYSCFKDCKHVHQKQKCSESDKPVSLLASLCLAYLHFSHLKYHERLSPHSLSVSIQWTEISALAIWLAINKSKEPKDKKKKRVLYLHPVLWKQRSWREKKAHYSKTNLQKNAVWSNKETKRRFFNLLCRRMTVNVIWN